MSSGSRARRAAGRYSIRRSSSNTTPPTRSPFVDRGPGQAAAAACAATTDLKATRCQTHPRPDIDQQPYRPSALFAKQLDVCNRRARRHTPVHVARDHRRAGRRATVELMPRPRNATDDCRCASPAPCPWRSADARPPGAGAISDARSIPTPLEPSPDEDLSPDRPSRYRHQPEQLLDEILRRPSFCPRPGRKGSRDASTPQAPPPVYHRRDIITPSEPRSPWRSDPARGWRRGLAPRSAAIAEVTTIGRGVTGPAPGAAGSPRHRGQTVRNRLCLEHGFGSRDAAPPAALASCRFSRSIAFSVERSG